MMTLIVMENGASANAMNASLEAAQSTGLALTVIAESSPNLSNSTFISSKGRSIEACLREAMRGITGSDRAILLDARLAPSSSAMKTFVKAAESEDAGIMYASLTSGSSTIELPDVDTSSILRAALSQEAWPTQLIAVRGSVLEGEADIAGQSSNEIGASIIAIAGARGESIERSPEALATSNAKDLELSTSARASVIEAAISAANIEELFPNHPWSTHKEESLAACYHTIAAMLIRLGKLDSATECLNQSDALEDSPRSLALKGIISMMNGEMLGAVANMVSSLQQYEQRKKEANGHYLKFSPKDMEVINSRLKSGLAALNRRDNEAALKQFSEAVFNFDAFYTELGIDSLESKNN